MHNSSTQIRTHHFHRVLPEALSQTQCIISTHGLTLQRLWEQLYVSHFCAAFWNHRGESLVVPYQQNNNTNSFTVCIFTAWNKNMGVLSTVNKDETNAHRKSKMEIYFFQIKWENIEQQLRHRPFIFTKREIEHFVHNQVANQRQWGGFSVGRTSHSPIKLTTIIETVRQQDAMMCKQRSHSYSKCTNTLATHIAVSDTATLFASFTQVERM